MKRRNHAEEYDLLEVLGARVDLRRLHHDDPVVDPDAPDAHAVLAWVRGLDRPLSDVEQALLDLAAEIGL